MLNFESLKDNFQKNKILVENFTFLSVLQVSNLVLFIITIPYLFRVLGSQNYGLIVFAQTTAFYFSIFINFGFNLTATRDISVNRDDRSKVTEIVSSVLTIKMIIFIVSLLLMAVLTFTFHQLREQRMIFMLSMLAGLSDALYPLWYFQGIEKMKYITIINVTTRILATILVFVIITRAGDYVIYPLILGIGTVTGALTGLLVVFRRHKVKFRFQSLTTLKIYLYDNVLYFFSNVSTQIYVNANKIIIGIFLGMVDVAYYDVAEKVINIIKVPYSLLGQTLFPKVSRDRDVSFLKKILIYVLLFSVIVIIVIYMFSPIVISFFSGSANANSIRILRVLSFTLIPIAISLIYGDLILINFGLKTEYARMRIIGFLFYFLIFTGLYISGELRVFNIAFMVVFVETFIAAYSYYLCYKAGLK
ncbi:MAG: oligosaccharide flippase family protein [Bacteroidales bacterium]|jgi:PST family polysaccharide transporter